MLEPRRAQTRLDESSTHRHEFASARVASESSTMDSKDRHRQLACTPRSWHLRSQKWPKILRLKSGDPKKSGFWIWQNSLVTQNNGVVPVGLSRACPKSDVSH